MTLSAAQPVARSRFLDLPALAALAHMRFVTRHQLEGSYGGRHRSRQQGGAAEFVDYREYSAGEDLRRLDWKVLARTNRPYVRLYENETNLLATFILDASGSMQFGDKLAYVQHLTTALSQIIVRQQDQVGAAIISDGLVEFLAPAGTSSHLLRIQEMIEQVKPKPSTRLSDGLRDLFGRLSRRGVLIVASDFLVDDLEQTFAALRLFRHRRSEVVILHIVHPDEQRLPAGVAFQFEGMENDGRVNCSPADIAQAYERRFESHCAMVRSMALAASCDYRRVSTAVPYLQTLSGFLVERSG